MSLYSTETTPSAPPVLIRVIFAGLSFSFTVKLAVVKRMLPAGLRLADELEREEGEDELVEVEDDEDDEERRDDREEEEDVVITSIPRISSRNLFIITATSARETFAAGSNLPSGRPRITPSSAISPTASSKYEPAGTSGNRADPRAPAAMVTPVTPRTRPPRKQLIPRTKREGARMRRREEKWK